VTIRHSLSSCHYLRRQLTLNKQISQENFALFKNLNTCKSIIYLQSYLEYNLLFIEKKTNHQIMQSHFVYGICLYFKHVHMLCIFVRLQIRWSTKWILLFLWNIIRFIRRVGSGWVQFCLRCWWFGMWWILQQLCLQNKLYRFVISQ